LFLENFVCFCYFENLLKPSSIVIQIIIKRLSQIDADYFKKKILQKPLQKNFSCLFALFRVKKGSENPFAILPDF